MGGIKNKLTSKVKTLLNSLPLAGEMLVAFRVGAHLASQKCDDKRADEMTKSSQSREGNNNNNNNNKVPLWLKGNVRRKSDKGIVGVGDHDPSVSPDGLPAPFTQREPNVPAHALSIHSKSPLFYALIATGILFVLAILAISIKLSFSNAAGEVEGANDTAIATLNNVDILQAGTGQSVTIKGEALNENDYGTDNATRRTILNNNIVRYNANYNVTKVGQITFSITLPANNTIDEATIAESQGCLPNLSKLESADITNSDGTITKSYTNNKAICVRNITTTGSTNWQITAYLWGANNTKIQPTLAVSGETSTIKPEEISVVGRGDYGVKVTSQYEFPGNSQYTQVIHFGVALYANGSDDLLGVAPIEDGGWSMTIDTSTLPDGWVVVQSANTPDSIISSTGLADNSMAHSGAIDLQSDDNSMTINMSNAATAVLHCPEVSNIDGMSADECYYSGFQIVVGVPYVSLPNSGEYYVLNFGNVKALVNGVEHIINPQPSELGWTLSSMASSQYGPWVSQDDQDLVDPVGWETNYGQGQPIYDGESVYSTLMLIYNAVPGKEMATNLNICLTFDSGKLGIDRRFTRNTTENGNVLTSDPAVQYGISIGGACGSVGDGSDNFFNTLDEANAYAGQIDQRVNAVRIHADNVMAWRRDGRIGSVRMTATNGNQTAQGPSSATMDMTATTNEWSGDSVGHIMSVTIVPGLLSHTLAATPSSTNPGKEDHITITTKTYNKDTDSKITVNLPEGLTPKEGSFTITTGYEYNDETNTNEPIKAVLIEGEGQDYTITSGDGSTSSDSSSTSSNSSGTIVTFNLDHIASTYNVPITGYDPIYPGESGVTNIALNSDTGLYEEVITTNNNNEDSDITNDDLPIAADNDGNGISHISTPIEFDVTVNEDTPSPSTLTINSTASGTGTDYASTTFKTASDTITVAEPPKTFGYDLTASSNNIYAGDDLTYSYSISNTTDTNATNIQMLTVLPFNGDSRGTTGLMDMTKQDGSSTTSNQSTITNPYTITNLSLSLPSDGVGGLDTSATKLYYTLDPKAHELEPNPEALALDSSITWQELELDSDGNIPTDTMTNLQQQGILDSITALKLTTTTLPSSSQLRLNVTLDNILATTPSTKATLANDITYLSYASEANQAVEQVAEQTVEGTTNTNTKTILRREGNITTYSNGQIVSVHQNPVTVNYLGELLALSIPENEQAIQVDLDLNDVVIGNADISGDSTNPVNHLSLVAATLRGYSLTAQTSTEDGALLTEQEDTHSIPAISTEPTKGTAGWSAKIAGSNNQSLAGTTWTAIPGINQTPLNLYASAAKGRDSRNLTVTYGFSAANTIADTYSAKVVYTVTAGL